MNTSGKFVRIILLFALGAMGVLAFSPVNRESKTTTKTFKADFVDKTTTPSPTGFASNQEFGNWTNFTKNNGLPSNKVFAVRADNDLLWIGTDAGLVKMEDGRFTTYTTEDGLVHNGVLSIDVSPITGDIWLATMGGLSRFSGGQFENYTQFNSGLANDVVYQVNCDGKDVWVATGGGASRLDTYTGNWSIFTERNAPMHEPWTYGVTSTPQKVYIAAWGGGVIELDKTTGQFRDYRDPDGEMELDLFPNDGLVHDITTGVSYSDKYLWVATYFGLSRYDGTHWNGYFDHDSGLASNFINAVKATGSVVWLCTDNGVSSFDGEKWITYQANDSKKGGIVKIREGNLTNKESRNNSIVDNYVLGVDFQDNKVFLATSGGLSIGTPVNGSRSIKKK